MPAIERKDKGEIVINGASGQPWQSYLLHQWHRGRTKILLQPDGQSPAGARSGRYTITTVLKEGDKKPKIIFNGSARDRLGGKLSGIFSVRFIDRNQRDQTFETLKRRFPGINFK